MPQRAPASIDMLHSVSRPSIDSARIAEPANSMAWRVAPSAPTWAMIASTMSLAAMPGAAAAIDGDAHARRLLLPDRLRHQHMRHFGGADAEGVGAERAVGRGVAVAADDQQARQGQALLGADHMHDALPGIVQAEQLDAVLGGVLLDLAHHPRQLGIGDVAPRAARRHVMVGDAEGQARLGDRDARAPPACRRRGTSPRARSGGRPRAATGRPRGGRSRGRPRACRSGFGAGSCREMTPRECQ